MSSIWKGHWNSNSACRQPSMFRVTVGVISGRLPAGRYATILYRGPYGGPDDGLYRANAALIGWGMERGVKWDSEQTPAGERFACRLEIYLIGPQSEPDPAKWETEVAIRVSDV